ncbi:MAG TPA: Maf family protein [Gemmatimonadaceae bacterium]|nr:Maf family protein [Gemmatimonadaceae bacterium]
MRVILASASPRRRQLLDLIGIAHEVRPSDIDETALRGERPRKYAERLAREKVRAVAESDPDAVAIAADTIVVCGAKLLGKPSNAVDAGSMLSALSGRMHKVVTAVAVARSGKVKSAVEEVVVTFRALTDDEIDAYIATGEPMDKAGAYGIQGYGATIVKRIEGDYFAVMGLPLVKLVGLLAELGVRYDFGALSVRSLGARKSV